MSGAFQPEQILLERSRHYAQLDPLADRPAAMLPSHLSWWVDEQRFCLPLVELRGVARSRITPVPLSRDTLVGWTAYADSFWQVRRVGGALRPAAPGVFTGNVLFLRSRRLALWCDHPLELISCDDTPQGEAQVLDDCPGLRAFPLADGALLLQVESA